MLKNIQLMVDFILFLALLVHPMTNWQVEVHNGVPNASYYIFYQKHIITIYIYNDYLLGPFTCKLDKVLDPVVGLLPLLSLLESSHLYVLHFTFHWCAFHRFLKVLFYYSAVFYLWKSNSGKVCRMFISRHSKFSSFIK